MIRDRQYPDSELARRSNEWLIRHFSGINIDSIQQGSRVYFSYPVKDKVEYVLEFQTQGNIRRVSFYVENPINNLVQILQENLEDDSAFRIHPVLSKYKSNLRKYKQVFKREEIGQKSIAIKITNKETSEKIVKSVPTAFVTSKIQKIPLGKEGRLSENFLKWDFDYIIRPVMIFVSEHK